MAEPSANGDNGRDARGRFKAGNAGGPGNPHSGQVSKLRAAMLEAVTPERLAKVVDALVRQAEAGNVAAIRELLDRTIGKPIPMEPERALDNEVRVFHIEVPLPARVDNDAQSARSHSI